MSVFTLYRALTNRGVKMKNFVWAALLCLPWLVNPFTVFAQTAATQPSQPTKNLIPVTLQLNWKHQFQFAGYYAALEQGYYRDVGLDVTIVEAQEDTTSEEAVLDGTAEFGIGASDLMLLRAQGEPIVVLAAIFQHSPQVLLTKSDHGIDHIHELANKRVMLEPHSAELLAYLADEGLTPSQFTQIPHKRNPTPLIKDEIDAMSAYLTDEPFLLKQAGIEYHVFSPRSASIDFYAGTLFTHETQINEHPQRVSQFLKASRRGWTYAFEHVDEIVALIHSKYSKRHSVEHLKYEAHQIRALAVTDLIEPGYMFKGRWQHIADTYTKLGMLPPDYSLEGFLYSAEPTFYHRWIMAMWSSIGIVFAIILMMIIAYNLRKFVIRGESETSENTGAEKKDNVASESGVPATVASTANEIKKLKKTAQRRSNLSSFFVTLLIGIAFGAMIDSVGNTVRNSGISVEMMLLPLTFFFISIRFFIGNQLHLQSPQMGQVRGLVWLYDLVIIIIQSAVLILLGGIVTIEANRSTTIGFRELLVALYTIDIIWIRSQPLLGKLIRSGCHPQRALAGLRGWPLP